MEIQLIKLNQVVYTIEEDIKEYEEDCKLCEGIGLLELKNGKKITCPKCDKGKKHKKKKVYHVQSHYIDGIESATVYDEYDCDYKIIKYYVDIHRYFPYPFFIQKDGKLFNSNNKEVKIFFNIEDVKQECNKRNKEQK